MTKLSREISTADYYQKLSPREVKKLIGCKSDTTLWRYVKLGLIPKPHYPSARRPLWRLGEVIECFENKLTPMDDRTVKFGVTTEQEKREEQSYLNKLKERFGIS